MQSMSREAKADWLEIICIMHDSPERGVLLMPNGRPMSDAELGRNLGLTLAQTRKSITTILESGTGFRREDGALFNKRMVKDEALRKVRTAAGSLGGNPNLVKQILTKTVDEVIQGDNQIPTPSSSSSSSISRKGERKPIAPSALVSSPEFLEFWAAYPKKKSKGHAARLWIKRRLDSKVGLILAAIIEQRTWPDWLKEHGQFIPHPASWLNSEGWLNEPDTPIPPNGNGPAKYTPEQIAEATERLRAGGAIK